MRRRTAQVAGDREAQALAATIGQEVRRGRVALGWTQAALAARVGIHQSWLGEIERGGGAGVPLHVWVALGIAIGRPLTVGLSRAIEPAVRDAGHLAVQELVLSLAQRHGRRRGFELSTKSLRSIDVGLFDDVQRVMILAEIWNTLDDVGAARRDTNRKVAEASDLALARGGPAFRVASCWVVRATAVNRALVSRFPSVFETAFPGSSREWVAALRDGAAPPELPGLVWADVAGTRLFASRRPASSRGRGARG